MANLSGKFLVPYDATSLFIEIPLLETIDTAINNHYKKNKEKLLKKARERY